MRRQRNVQHRVDTLGLPVFIVLCCLVQVLPKFCKVFTTEEAGTGPNGMDVNEWLTGVMDGMVGAIDEHVVNVLQQAGQDATASSKNVKCT